MSVRDARRGQVGPVPRPGPPAGGEAGGERHDRADHTHHPVLPGLCEQDHAAMLRDGVDGSAAAQGFLLDAEEQEAPGAVRGVPDAAVQVDNQRRDHFRYLRGAAGSVGAAV
ncbi:ABC multidrug transporter, putative [Babesia caballi]|uniref:ABC multidrug transporter, putative n=1 Tax=Babesia caballi TaxID=5871 RepID=A0AAV4LMA8_BABCB|nr:ABC multidrug transporter, putative [Babesia caballi]